MERGRRRRRVNALWAHGNEDFRRSREAADRGNLADQERYLQRGRRAWTAAEQAQVKRASSGCVIAALVSLGTVTSALASWCS